MNNKIEVIGIDHGWSNIKTSSQVFVTGVKEITTEPALFDGVLEYKGRYYKVGGFRQEVRNTKTEDDTFYLLTLAAVAKELKRRGLYEAKVFLAVGLPLTRFGSEKADFLKYLTAERDVEFLYESIKYHIVIENAAVFPQCYAAVADRLQSFGKKTLIVDIGSWTIDLMPVIDKVPDESKCVTVPRGLITCMRTINAGMDVTNERQKVEVSVIKKDAETKEALSGAIFGLYAKEDIVDADGRVIVKADTMIEKAVTGEDGTVTFVSDLPLGNYYVKEIEAPKGYVKSDEVFDVVAAYQEGVAVIEFEAEFVNYPTKLEISKTDITGELELKGATLSIIDADGNVVASWVSDGKTHVIERVPVGKYIFREEIAPYGYKIANDVEFEVTETKEIQKVSMKDELVKGKIIIEKTDEYTKKGIAGVEFEIRDKDGKVIETLVTDKNGHAESGELDIAMFKDGEFVEDIKYYVVETKAADGYILEKEVHEVVLQYDDAAPEVVTYTLNLTNRPTEPKLPQTGDNFNPWLWAGIGLTAMLAGVGAFLWRKKEDDEVTE